MGQKCCGTAGRGGNKQNSKSKENGEENMNVVIFLSSVRPNRMADRVGKCVKKKVEATGMTAKILDPLELNFDIYEVPFHEMAKGKTSESLLRPPGWLSETNKKIQSADGYIIISTEYNSNVPPALLNLLNNFSPTVYDNRPCGIITYSMGRSGGIRAQNLLSVMVGEFWMVTVPTRVTIPTVHEAFTEDGKCLEKSIGNSIDVLIEEVKWYADAIKTQKKNRQITP